MVIQLECINRAIRLKREKLAAGGLERIQPISGKSMNEKRARTLICVLPSLFSGTPLKPTLLNKQL